MSNVIPIRKEIALRQQASACERFKQKYPNLTGLNAEACDLCNGAKFVVFDGKEIRPAFDPNEYLAERCLHCKGTGINLNLESSCHEEEM